MELRQIGLPRVVACSLGTSSELYNELAFDVIGIMGDAFPLIITVTRHFSSFQKRTCQNSFSTIRVDIKHHIYERPYKWNAVPNSLFSLGNNS